jgi:DNA-binding PadR family transcriptional regulator
MGRALSHHSTLILASLQSSPGHGYAIRKDIARRTDGEVQLGSTTLYRLLAQLADQGLIEEVDAKTPNVSVDERRRCYRVTPPGRRALAADLRLLERVLLAARTDAARSR